MLASRRSLTEQKAEAEQQAGKLHQQYNRLMEAARGQGPAALLLEAHSRLAALKQQCRKVHFSNCETLPAQACAM